jgi:hypothetical protein
VVCSKLPPSIVAQSYNVSTTTQAFRSDRLAIRLLQAGDSLAHFLFLVLTTTIRSAMTVLQMLATTSRVGIVRWHISTTLSSATNGSMQRTGQKQALGNTGPFETLQVMFYWTETEYAAVPDRAWAFALIGRQAGIRVTDSAPYLSVHSGKVPEPSTASYLALSLLGAGFVRRRSK